MSRSVLLIDDDPAILSLLERFFESRGWLVSRAADGRLGAQLYEQDRPDLVILDLDLPGLSGMRLLEVLRRRDADATVILLTGHGDIASAVEAMRLGAENFLTKPVELAHLEAAAERAYEKVELRRRNRFFAERQAEGEGIGFELGRSRAMRAVTEQVELLARSDTTALLLGETGTGKGYLAHLIHTRSARAAGPFVNINCAGLTATFLDSELFGHEKGAFTDARAQKRGLFEIADGGTLFLDEVGDLATELQPKLLKVIESRKFRRLGGTREIEVDVRVVAATNHDLEAGVRTGEFRGDLYYRLAVLPVRLPPLRERSRDDIVDLALSATADLCRRMGLAPVRVDPEALRLLAAYAWPGNIRELRNVLERVLLLRGADGEIRPEHLPPELGRPLPEQPRAFDLDLSLEEVERAHIAAVLTHRGGNRSQAARSLGISRATLYEKLRKFGLEEVGRA